MKPPKKDEPARTEKLRLLIERKLTLEEELEQLKHEIRREIYRKAG